MSGNLQQQIDLRSGACTIEKRSRSQRSCCYEVLDHKRLPTRAHHRVTEQRLLVSNSKQRVHNAAVAYKHLWGFDKAFPDVRLKGLQAANQHQIHQQIQIPRDRLAINGETARKLGSVEQASL